MTEVGHKACGGQSAGPGVRGCERSYLVERSTECGAKRSHICEIISSKQNGGGKSERR